MMINKRLISIVPDSRKYIVSNVFLQWISLIGNIAVMWSISYFLYMMYRSLINEQTILLVLGVSITAIIVRYICTNLSSRMSYLSSRSVKTTLRGMIYKKLLQLGSGYKDKLKTSDITQVAVEGVEQLETYFGSYLPQLFYSMIAPLTLFIVLSFISLKAASVLLVCVPLIPVTIILVQKWTKKLLGKYWGEYTTLGDTFLENLQGLTTLKIYQSDEFKHQQMNFQSERFRKITMKVLTMQLNSITIMDLIAYGGSAIGIIIAISELYNGNITLFGCLLIILLSAEFFLPMRLLGSFFHIAMNGMAASDKIFGLLDLKVEDSGINDIGASQSITIEQLGFSYDGKKKVLDDVSISIPKGGFVSIVGESGCGKSTIASILMKRHHNYSGSIKIGDMELTDIKEDSLMRHITYINHKSYLFKGSVRENLLIANPDASDDELWDALCKVNLSSFLKAGNGLDTELDEKGANLSGGQCQRLALARALLHDCGIYIFDEATSNIDIESENDIMNGIIELARTKTVILISHRLMNVVDSDNIYVLDDSKVVEQGSHNALLEQDGHYAQLWKAQQELENFVKEDI